MADLKDIDLLQQGLYKRLFGDKNSVDTGSPTTPQNLQPLDRSPSAQSGGTLQGQRQAREANVVGAGYAEPTFGNILGAFGNAMAVTDPLSAGFLSMSELAAGQPPGTFGGFTNIGHSFDPDLVAAIRNGTKTIQQATTEQEKRNKEHAIAAARAAANSAIANGLGMRIGHPGGLSAGRAQTGPGGGYGGSYGAGDRTSAGPGGVLGHI